MRLPDSASASPGGREPGRVPKEETDDAENLTDSRSVTIVSCMTTDFASALRDASLRVTRPRLAVLAAVHERPHVDTETVIDKVRAELGAVSHQAVYDVLRVLTAAGLLRRIQPAGATARYEARVGDNHHHAVCRSCGVIADVECAVGHTPCLTASDDRGFTIDEAEVVYWGICPTCSTTLIPQANTMPGRIHS